tara:strand:- start:411 stop:539 length:129 start_codon:yes stop_codon:yes gene_type:complete
MTRKKQKPNEIRLFKNYMTLYNGTEPPGPTVPQAEILGLKTA